MSSIRSTSLCGAIVCAMAITAWAAAPGGGGAGTQAGGAPQGGRQNRANQAPVGLAAAMGAMERQFRAIKADAADPANQEAAIRNIDLMIRNSAISKLEIPVAIGRLPADKRADAVKSYHSMMLSTIKTLIALEEAVLDKKPDEIKKCIAQLDDLEKRGHAEFFQPG